MDANFAPRIQSGIDQRMPRRKVTVTIDALELRGVPPGAQHEVVESLRRELERQMSADAFAERVGESRSVRALPTRPLPAARTPSRLGASAAAGIVEGLKP